MAEADESELVREVQEYYGDYFAINPELFTFNLFQCMGDKFQSWDPSKFSRTADGLLSVLLSLKKRPLIRYDKNSGMATRLAQEIQVFKI